MMSSKRFIISDLYRMRSRVIALLIFCTVIIGVHPRLLLDIIVPSFKSPLFDGLRKAAGL